MRILVIVVATIAALVRPVPAAAGAITVDDPLWYEFGFGATGTFAFSCPGCAPSSGGNSQFADAPPWTFAAPAGGASLTVTDAFLRGDEFEVFDSAVSIGSTPVAAEVGTCGSDPVPCLADPLVSHLVYALAAGLHSITIKVTDSPFGSGAAYFRVDSAAAPPIPEPASLFLLGSGLVGLAVRRRRQRKIS